MAYQLDEALADVYWHWRSTQQHAERGRQPLPPASYEKPKGGHDSKVADEVRDWHIELLRREGRVH